MEAEIQAFTQQYYAQLLDITDSLSGNVIPFDLARLMYLESRLQPWAVNDTTNATGLIQFMPTTAKSLGTTVAALRTMSVEQQLPYVKKYFHSPGLGNKTYNNLGDLYLGIFYPAAVGKPDSYVIGVSPSKTYTGNKGLDANKDGTLSAGDVRNYVNAKYGAMQFDSSFLSSYEEQATTNYIPPFLARNDTRNWLYFMASLAGVGIIVINREKIINTLSS